MATPVLPARKPLRTIPLNLLVQAYIVSREQTVEALSAYAMRRPNSVRWLLQDGGAR